MADKVILSEEPSSVRINIQDPNKPKAQNSAGKMVKVQQKVPFIDRIISALFGSEVNSQNVAEHIIKDYAIPAGKKMLNNGIQSGLKHAGDAAQVMIFGKVINSNNGPTDYTSFSKPNSVQVVQSVYRVMDQVDTFAFTRKEDADRCLNYLRGRISEYHSVSVVDYFEWINSNLNMQIPLDYNLTDRGWLDLSMARVSQSAEGYIIELPKPVFLKRG